jgi:predicted Zn-dependent protease
MGKQWARKEAKENWVAVGLENAGLWIRHHQQASVWGGLGLVAAILLGAGFYSQRNASMEESWSKYAFAQSYAYSRQPQQAIDQIQKLETAHPGSAATSYGLLLAGDILFEQERFAEATVSYEKVVARPNHVETLPLGMASLTLTKEAVSDFPSAIDNGERFLSSYPEHFLAPQVHASVARSYAASGKEEQAQSTYQRIVFLYSGTYWEGWAKARMQG